MALQEEPKDFTVFNVFFPPDKGTREMRAFEALIESALAELTAIGRIRRLRSLESLGLVDFSSNDYLGLSRHPDLIARAASYAKTYGAGSRASRLVSGNLAPFSAIEDKLARLKGKEAALVMASGFQANATILPVVLELLARRAPPMVFADRLNHASLHHGLKAAGARAMRFRHNDLTHLEDLLRRHQGEDATRLIVTESVFSMDGDCADIAALVALARRYDAVLYVDEAHATGVLGPKGGGLTPGHEVDIAMGTFSKALGGFGAYIACSAALRDYLINRCGGLIYSTALPPAILGAMEAALDIVPDLEEERARIAAYAKQARESFKAAGLEVGASTTHIVPVILGEEQRVLAVAKGLEQDGFLVGAIRPPTVPAGSARLRISFSAAHKPEQVASLIECVVARAS